MPELTPVMLSRLPPGPNPPSRQPPERINLSPCSVLNRDHFLEHK